MIVERAGVAHEGLRRATIDPALPQKDYALLEPASDRLEHLPARPSGWPSSSLVLGLPLALVIVIAALFLLNGSGTNILHWATWTVGWAVAAGVFSCGVWMMSPRSPLAAIDSSALRKTARRCRAHYVTGNELELGDRMLLRRAQKACDAVLESGVYADGMLDQAAVKAELTGKEWAIADDLRKLSGLRASREEVVPGRRLSREARDRLRKHMRDEREAEQGILAQVETLEIRATDVERIDSAYEDFMDRVKVDGLGDQLRDLLASVSAHKEQAEGITDLEQQADALYLAFEELGE